MNHPRTARTISGIYKWHFSCQLGNYIYHRITTHLREPGFTPLIFPEPQHFFGDDPKYDDQKKICHLPDPAAAGFWVEYEDAEDLVGG